MEEIFKQLYGSHNIRGGVRVQGKGPLGGEGEKGRRRGEGSCRSANIESSPV